jgi:hypothetical protein
MWQLKKLSTNEPLSEAGPLPNNWGPIFGLHGFLDKIGDLSWVGPTYADKGWVRLTDKELAEIKKTEIINRLELEKNIANTALSAPNITVRDKTIWIEYLQDLNTVCLSPNFHCSPDFPVRPVL